ncbi:T-cell surface antigen CD2-like isoform X2 [Pungitius pungitius]|uniref:T-cell surface antigen CD2-like isoform X2 n=1 Tax=Pungitius pungitius TaxID=134920 RepID=UPI002E1583BD
MFASPGDMEAVVGLFVMLLGVSHGVETHCDGRQNRAQCFGALGGTLVLQLMNNASKTHKYQWSKNETIILSGKNDSIVFNRIENRSLFTPSNGTLRINNLSRTDGGEYELKTFSSDGKLSGPRVQQLTIQAPVSSVLSVHECLSHGEQKVSCSSEGADSPRYSWTLDGHNLTDSELLSGNTERNIITLKQHVSGRLVCSVRNDVSSYSKEETVSTCGFIFINCTSANGTRISQWVFAANNTLCIETTASPTNTALPRDGEVSGITVSTNEGILTTAAYVLAALVLLLVVGVSVVCAHKKKQKNKLQEEDNQELTYSEVRIGPRPGRQMKQRAEEEVEYGEVKFSQRPRHNVEPAADECVYAKVRRER